MSLKSNMTIYEVNLIMFIFNWCVASRINIYLFLQTVKTFYSVRS